MESEAESVKNGNNLTTPSFDFHYVMRALTTPLTIPTQIPSLVKTNGLIHGQLVYKHTLNDWK